MRKTELVIFDMDGVLLDSESLYWKVNFEFFDDLGVDITHDEYNSFIGISGKKMWNYIKEKGNLSQSISSLITEEKQRKHDALAREELVPNNGLYNLLDYLKVEKIDCCIASSGLMKNVQLILEKLNVEEYFSHLVSGEMVTNGKPSPDIFLQAAEHFSTKTSNCVVIEDSRNGVEAAKSGNMNCIGYINEGSGNQDLSKADLIVDSLIDQRLFEFIKT